MIYFYLFLVLMSGLSVGFNLGYYKSWQRRREFYKQIFGEDEDGHPTVSMGAL